MAAQALFSHSSVLSAKGYHSIVLALGAKVSTFSRL